MCPGPMLGLEGVENLKGHWLKVTRSKISRPRSFIALWEKNSCAERSTFKADAIGCVFGVLNCRGLLGRQLWNNRTISQIDPAMMSPGCLLGDRKNVRYLVVLFIHTKMAFLLFLDTCKLMDRSQRTSSLTMGQPSPSVISWDIPLLRERACILEPIWRWVRGFLIGGNASAPPSFPTHPSRRDPGEYSSLG